MFQTAICMAKHTSIRGFEKAQTLPLLGDRNNALLLAAFSHISYQPDSHLYARQMTLANPFRSRVLGYANIYD